MYNKRVGGTVGLVFVYIVSVEMSWSQNKFDLVKYNESQIINLDFNSQQNKASGSLDFSKLTGTKLFIDKTLLIREIFCYKSLIITAPRYFGKSLNMNMLNMFLSNAKKIEDVSSIFNGTKIWSHRKFVQRHCCSYPVLFCSFHSYIEVTNLESLLRSIKHVLLTIFYKHFYLNSSDKLDKNSKETFAKYIKRNKNLTVTEVKSGLKTLSRLMFSHYGTKVIILIDDYDEKILNNIFDEHFKLQQKEKEQLKITEDIIQFHKDIICDLIKDTGYVDRVIITGILTIDICNCLANNVNLKTIGFLRDDRFGKYFGFTKDDLVRLIFKFRLNRDERCELTEWYESYSSKSGELEVFNPLSVSEFLMVRSGNSFWADTKPFRMLGILPLLDNSKILDTFIKIANKTEIALRTREKFSAQDLLVLKKTSENWWDNHTDTDLFFHLMLQMGYLTFTFKNNSQVLDKDVLRIPNYEVRKEMVSFLFEYLDITNNTEPDLLDY